MAVAVTGGASVAVVGIAVTGALGVSAPGFVLDAGATRGFFVVDFAVSVFFFTGATSVPFSSPPSTLGVEHAMTVPTTPERSSQPASRANRGVTSIEDAFIGPSSDPGSFP